MGVGLGFNWPIRTKKHSFTARNSSMQQGEVLNCTLFVCASSSQLQRWSIDKKPELGNKSEAPISWSWCTGRLTSCCCPGTDDWSGFDGSNISMLKEASPPSFSDILLNTINCSNIHGGFCKLTDKKIFTTTATQPAAKHHSSPIFHRQKTFTLQPEASAPRVQDDDAKGDNKINAALAFGQKVARFSMSCTQIFLSASCCNACLTLDQVACMCCRCRNP